MKKEKACGIVVYKKKDEKIYFLIIKHNLKNREDYWNFPKGHVEFQESEEQTALREVFEETGLEIEIEAGFKETYQYETINWNQEKIVKTVVFFVGQSVGDQVTINPIEIADYRWADFEQAKKLLSYESSRVLLAEANKYIKNYK